MSRVLRTNKCGFCGVKGHNIAHCSSEKGKEICLKTISIAMDIFALRSQSIHERAMFFHEYLKIGIIKELRFTLTRIGFATSGTKPQLIARIVHRYFYQYVVPTILSESPDVISMDDRLHMDEYVKFWWNISNGMSFDESNRSLRVYFNSLSKFQIEVIVKPIDENEKPSTFECAICMEDECSLLDKVDIGCKHSFCNQCVTRVMMDSREKRKHPCCALCRSDYKTMTFHTRDHVDIFKEQFCSL
jgi:hypothetical protein